MNNPFDKDVLPALGEAIDPVEMARRDMRKALPKRFFARAECLPVADGFALLLDGKPALSPARKRLVVHNEAVAQALADEWMAQSESIDPGTMPLTRLLNAALDGVAGTMDGVADEIVRYAGSDLLCYRAGEPDALVQDQMRAWDPVLDWMRDTHGARFTLAEGVMHVDQTAEAVDATRRALDTAVGSNPEASLRLAALSTVTTLTGSALIALALAHGRLNAREAWDAAHVDEDFQMRVWGEDSDALARRARRWTEMEAAALVLRG